MPWTVYAILIVFGVFVLLMIINPRLSCFGRKISSPLYPIMRKKKQRQLKTEDYGFSLVDEGRKVDKPSGRKDHKDVRLDKTEDYGFHLSGEEERQNSGDSGKTDGGKDK